MFAKAKKKFITHSVEFNGKTLTLETGKLAGNARSAVVVKQGGTTVLVAVTTKLGDGSSDFLPLRIDYEERYYAGGIISGSKYSRREGNPNNDAIISGRLIDHAIRPLFPKDYIDETQIVVTVLSIDGESSPALLGFLGTSAALSIAGLPFSGPIVLLNLEKVDGKIDCNLDQSHKDTVMTIHTSYTKNGELVQAIEAEAHLVKESEIIEAIKEGAKKVKPLFDFLNEFKEKCNVKEKDYVPSWLNDEVKEEFRDVFFKKLDVIEKEGDTLTREDWQEYEEATLTEMLSKHEEKYSKEQLKLIFDEIQKEYVRDMVLNKGKRIDGRGFDEIRPLSAEVGLIERVHGSALFNRGSTQALTITTLASTSQSLATQNMEGEDEKKYFHHYNFPPYSTGEVGKVGGANRRSIGHGILAEKALIPVLPKTEDFSYVIRTVSEILSSNGSTSMASTCGSSLSLMDAGVPIKEHVAGIGVGLFIDKKKIENAKASDFTVLTDIMGQEDFAGYMDFKMTGTRDAVTAIQLELKLKGIPLDLLDKIFEVSNSARQKVLDVMYAAIPSPRSALSEFAPKLVSLSIQKDQIGALIGSGGSNIKGLMEQFGVEINVEEKDDTGFVVITSKDQKSLDLCKQYIHDMFKEVKIGEEYTGKVTRIEDYGAFIEILPKQEGLLHVSEYSYDFVSNIRDFLDLGDMVKVKVKGLENGKISLTRKGLFENPNPNKVQIQTNMPVNRSSRDRGGFRPNNNNGGGGRFNGGGNRGRDNRGGYGRNNNRRDEDRDRRPPRPVSNG